MITHEQKVHFLNNQIEFTQHEQNNKTSNTSAHNLHNRLRVLKAILEDYERRKAKLEVVG